MDVLLYWDKGVGKHSGNEMFQSLKAAFDPSLYHIKKVDHSFLATENWEMRTSLLVMPGGRDIPYHELLKGTANRKISHFVENGGNYLGICAGAYYGSAFIEFEKGGPLEVCSSRELAFFPGIAQGPALGKGQFCYRGYQGVAAAKLDLNFGSHSSHFTANIFYNGGCSFKDPENYPSVTVLGRYQTQYLPDLPPMNGSDSNSFPLEARKNEGAILENITPSFSEPVVRASREKITSNTTAPSIDGNSGLNAAAIIECTKGRGKAILCGVHPEIAASSLERLSENSSHMQQIYSKLILEEKNREKLWKLILSSFSLKAHYAPI